MGLNLKELKENLNVGEVSDGYHTYNELYDHRCLLYLLLCQELYHHVKIIKNHYDGWDCVYLELPTGQISYHVKSKMVEDCDVNWEFISEKENPYDGHTPQDVVERMRKYLSGDYVPKV